VNPIETALDEDLHARKLFNELVENVASTQHRPFNEVYLELSIAFNSLMIYIIEEEP